jgi:GntR family transcriptional regulator, transcriptional repressor for pyruvate dehydrogenase complex
MYLPVKKHKSIPELIVQQVRDSILKGVYQVGEKLPTERELVIQFQASRLAVREALKGLQASGLIVVKRGSGIYVNESSSTALVESLSALLRIRKASLQDLTEARMLFEPAITRFACQSRTDEDLVRLEKNIQESSSLVKANQRATKENIEFHAIIAQATHNPVITVTMATFFEVLTDITLEVTGLTGENLKRSKRSVKEHVKILKALRERDGEGVYRMAISHVEMVQRSLGKNAKAAGIS